MIPHTASRPRLRRAHLAILLAAAAVAATATSAPADAEADTRTLIAAGDVCAAKFDADGALEFYLPAAKRDPENPRVLAAISREYRHLMTDDRAEDDKLRLGRIALDYAQRAADAGPNDSDAQLAPAITYGKMLDLLGDKAQFEASKKIKACADRALALDPENDLAWHILGCWNLGFAEVSGIERALGGVLFGKLPKTTHADAERCFRRAIKLNPDRLMHFIELGRTYIGMEREKIARKYIEKGLAMKRTEKDDPQTKAEGRALLKDLD